MRITTSFFLFIFLGVAIAGAVPGVRDNAVAGGKGDHAVADPSGISGHLIPSGEHYPVSVSRRDIPTDIPHTSLDHPKPTGKHAHPAFRRSPTDVYRSPVSHSVPGRPKSTGKHPHPSVYRRNGPSKHHKPTESRHSHPTVTRRADLPDVTPSVSAHSTDLSDHHSHDPAVRRAAETNGVHLPTSIASGGLNHPAPTGKQAHLPASHEARAPNAAGADPHYPH